MTPAVPASILALFMGYPAPHPTPDFCSGVRWATWAVGRGTPRRAPNFADDIKNIRADIHIITTTGPHKGKTIICRVPPKKRIAK